MRNRELTTLVLAFVLISVPIQAAETLVEINEIVPDEIVSVGFELPRAVDVDIEAVGLRPRSGDQLRAYAWLLDSDTREPVWAMERRGRDRVRGRGMRVTAEHSLHLEAGRYELYMCALNRWYGDWNDGESIDNVGDFFRALSDAFRGSRNRDFEDELDRCYVTLTSADMTRGEVKSFEVTGDLPGALLRFNKLGDGEYIKQGFTLSRPGKIRVYALVEMPDRTAVDQGWIVNADTKERVWEVGRRNVDRAGGGRKNGKVDEEIELDAGNYILYYATDDSHSFEFFNTNPPFDPMNWGITLLPGEGFQAASFKEYDPPGRGDALVDLTRARDDDYLEQPFKLDREAQLHITCLGEYAEGSDEFVDYGSIQEAATGRVVWEMTRRNTDFAGGGSKNRIFDGTVTLPAGAYIAHYTTDGSHAYRDWNTTPPYEAESWGLAIYPGPGFAKGSLTRLSEQELASGSEVLARLIRVRDDQERQARFTLAKPTLVRIYALGEGDDGDMHDYGWIENAKTGRTVWDMSWRRTRHAGGARKNRLYDGDLELDAGTYEVHYVTDGSHSFNDWNAARPRNSQNWGITVSALEDGGR